MAYRIAAIPEPESVAVRVTKAPAEIQTRPPRVPRVASKEWVTEGARVSIEIVRALLNGDHTPKASAARTLQRYAPSMTPVNVWVVAALATRPLEERTGMNAGLSAS